MKALAVIDADILLYQSCSVVEVATDWGNDIWTLHSDAKEAMMIFDCTVSDILEKTSACRAVLCFSGPSNWRKHIYREYKANRKANRKPICFVPVREYVMKHYDTMIEPDLEADDCVGLISTGPKSRWRGCDRTVMVSEDKDLKSIPGTLYNPRTNEISVISKAEANRFHLFQTLVGDQTDNYPGCPGIGAVRAARMLDESPCWETVVSAYEAAGLSEGDALVQAQIARILRHRDYNFRTKDINVWNPTRSSLTSEK